MTWTVTYYNERVKRDVLSFPVGILAGYRRLVAVMLEHGPDLGMPYSRAMGAGLFELRPHGREGIGRVFYCTCSGSTVVILHSFVKKSQRTPDDELQVARRRLREVLHCG